MNEENEIEKKISISEKIKPFESSEENFNSQNNNYKEITNYKSRNNKKISIINISLDHDKKNRTDINDCRNKKNNKFIFRTSDSQNEYNSTNILNEEITILSEKYISLSCDKIKKPLKKELNPLNTNHQKNKKSACNLTQLYNINKKTYKINSYHNLSPKLISSLEMKGNTEIIATTKVRKISNSSENEIIDKNNTNTNYVMNLNIENNIQNLINQIDFMTMKNENKFLKNAQLDAIQEVFEEENDSKTKSKNNMDGINEINSDRINYDNFISGKKYNSNFSSERESKNNAIINTTSISSKFGTGIYTNNIFDIPSDGENNINYIENNNFENEKDNVYKTITDIEHDSDYNNLNPIKQNENDNSISFMNVSDINKLFYSPSKKVINNIGYNNLVINNLKYNNTSVPNKKNKLFEEFIIKIPHINNNFKQNNNNVINNNNGNNIINNKDKAYIKKTIKKSSKIKPQNLKILISPKNLNKPKNFTNKIKEIKLPLNKNVKIFFKDIEMLNKINNNIFEFDNNTLKSLNFLKNKIYTKAFKVPVTNIKKIIIDTNTSIEEIEQIRKNNISFLNKKNYTNDNDNFNVSTILTTFDKNTQNSENIIKKGNIEINQFNLLEKKNLTAHSRNKSRNKVDQNNSLFNQRSSLINISSELNSCEINQGNSNEKNEIKHKEKKINKINVISNIQINNDKQNQKIINHLSFASNSHDEKKFYISKESYEEFFLNIIKQTQNLMNELLEKNSKLISNNFNKNKDQELSNLILDLEKQIKILKYNYLCVLIKKHFSKTKTEKLKIIKFANIPYKREIFYKYYQKILNKIKQDITLDNINKKLYIDKIIQMLKNYKTISKFDIKYTKKIFKEENKITPEILDSKFRVINNRNNIKEDNGNILKVLKDNNIINKKIVVSTSVIIPILYGINYLMHFYNNYK